MSRRRAGGLAAVLLALAAFGGQQVAARRGASGPPKPQCAPPSLNGSAQLPGTTLSVSPLPGSRDASPRTQISLLGVAPDALEGVSARGSTSGTHAGRLAAYSQGDGASFLPSRAFQPGELVTVRGRVREGPALRSFAFSFTVSQPDVLPYAQPTPKPAGKRGEVQAFHSQPGLHPPTPTVSTSARARQQPGYVFAAPYSGPGQNGPMIFNSEGQLVWFRPLPLGTEATNLAVQSYEGHHVLTWWQGYIPPQGFGQGEDVVANSSYHTLLRVRAGNGFRADLHDFHLTGNGTALVTVFNPIRCDLSSVGGSSRAAVTDGVFQELDLRTGLVRREWHSVDHVPLSDSYASARSSSLEWPFDYFHINTIEPARNGDLLVSSRNTSALYLVNPATEQIALRVGGKHSSVALAANAATAYQHDAQELPDGDFSIFDNGGVPMVHRQSRGIIVSIDPDTGRDELLDEFVHPTPLQSPSQGNMQLLPNRNAFIGWGTVPDFSEFTPRGKLVFDAHFPTPTASYRGYRFQWKATPSQPPSVAVTPRKRGGVNVYASWNGATGVAAWRLLGGANTTALSPLGSDARRGFETAIATPGAPAYVAVQALDSAGAVLGTSRTISR
ncbi:MAG: arylsulfotransferase family protein [Solirubrobacterales bacterium]|nr:arylsulfotransferase family protein [Solirubrobacterales bacterium]